MKVRSVLTHMVLWIALTLVLFSAFGQRVRAHEVNGELIYQIRYDYLMLVVIALDMIGKVVMFYNYEWLIIKNAEGLRYKSAMLILLALGWSLIVWFVYDGWLLSDTAEMIADYMLPYSLVMQVVIFLLAMSYAGNKQKTILKERQDELEKEHLNMELQLLKSQVSPHFLFNTLNNIYAIARKSANNEVQESIERLAGIMRYMTYKSVKHKVSLSEEVAYLTDYIALQEMRLAKKGGVSFDYNIKGWEQVEIAPMLLMPFVENTFKHGAASGNIKIRIDHSEDQLSLQTANDINPTNGLDSSGAGLANVKKRLVLIYPDQYSLNLFEREGVFHVELKLKLF